MKVAVVLIGPSAVGKTAVVRKLLPILSRRRAIGVIHGDFLSHVTFPFVASDDQLDLKYRNMASLIANCASIELPIIIHDLWRRPQDGLTIISALRAAQYQIVTIRLWASINCLQQRNRCRDPLDFVSEQHVMRMACHDQDISWPADVVIDTTNQTLDETVALLLTHLRPFLGGN